MRCKGTVGRVMCVGLQCRCGGHVVGGNKVMVRNVLGTTRGGINRAYRACGRLVQNGINWYNRRYECQTPAGAPRINKRTNAWYAGVRGGCRRGVPAEEMAFAR